MTQLLNRKAATLEKTFRELRRIEGQFKMYQRILAKRGEQFKFAQDAMGHLEKLYAKREKLRGRVGVLIEQVREMRYKKILKKYKGDVSSWYYKSAKFHIDENLHYYEYKEN